MKTHSTLRLTTGLTTLILLSAGAGSAMSQTSGKLTLYAAENFQGDSRTITSDQSNLSAVKADNFAYSLKASGRWEVCMDAGYRAGCFQVTGDVKDLGSNGGSISSARYLGPGSTPTHPSAAPTAGAPTSQPQATPGPVMAGRIYRSDWGDMTVDRWQPGFAGSFAHEDGRVEGAVAGRTVSGLWYQSSSAQQCPTASGGTYYWGSFTFEFSPDYSTYKGLWGYCDETPYQKWDGVQIGGPTGLAAAPGPASPRSAATANVSDYASGTTEAFGDEPSDMTDDAGVAGRIGKRATDAAEREVGDRVESGVGKAIGKIFGN